MLYNKGNQLTRVVDAHRKSLTAYSVIKRTYNSENPNPPATPNTTATGGNTPNASTTTGGDESKTLATALTPDPKQSNTEKAGDNPISVYPPEAQEYIERLRAEAAKANRELKALKLAAEKAEEEKLESQQEWKKLAETRAQRIADLEPVALQLDEIKAAFEATLTAKLAALPEDVRKELEPVRASMKPVEFSKWLDAMIPRFTHKPPNLDAGAGGTSGKRALAKGDLKPASY